MSRIIRDIIISLVLALGIAATFDFVRTIGAPPTPSETPPPIAAPVSSSAAPVSRPLSSAQDTLIALPDLPMTSGIYVEPNTRIYFQPRRP